MYQICHMRFQYHLNVYAYIFPHSVKQFFESQIKRIYEISNKFRELIRCADSHFCLRVQCALANLAKVLSNLTLRFRPLSRVKCNMECVRWSARRIVQKDRGFLRILHTCGLRMAPSPHRAIPQDNLIYLSIHYFCRRIGFNE